MARPLRPRLGLAGTRVSASRKRQRRVEPTRSVVIDLRAPGADPTDTAQTTKTVKEGIASNSEIMALPALRSGALE